MGVIVNRKNCYLLFIVWGVLLVSQGDVARADDETTMAAAAGGGDLMCFTAGASAPCAGKACKAEMKEANKLEQTCLPEGAMMCTPGKMCVCTTNDCNKDITCGGTCAKGTGKPGSSAVTTEAVTALVVSSAVLSLFGNQWYSSQAKMCA